MKDEKTLKREVVASQILFSKYPAHPPQDSGYWKDMFIEGAKWQEEKDKNKYSKKDLKEAYAMGRNSNTIVEFKEKFKKK